MSFIAKHSRLLLVAVACAAIGAGASAIAGAGAATPSAAKPTAAAKAGRRAHGLRRWATRAVHGDLVVKAKTGFVTLSFDRGRVDSVDGQRLTLTEGTRKASYKTVTVALGSDALVRDNGKTAQLSDLKAGQRVTVVQAPKRTLVVARTPKAG
ncbi:MAG TPA: hypothetical protein VGL51_09900 [Solirubrobacteraceae bacterium]|jgi:hypothetical protein